MNDITIEQIVAWFGIIIALGGGDQIYSHTCHQVQRTAEGN